MPPVRAAAPTLLLFALLAGCASDPPPPPREPPDPFHAKVLAGCSSEPECRQLHAEALRRVAPCDYYRVQVPLCTAARQNALTTAGYVRPYDEQRAAAAAREEQARLAREAEAEEQRRRAAAEREAAERARLEAEQKAAEERRAAEEREQAQKDLPANLSACSTRHDDDACAALRDFTTQYPSDPKTPQAAAVLKKHDALVAQREQAQRRAAEAAERANAAPAPEPQAGRVCCCDGTISPTCTYAKRGCCSHHGGVCACD